MNTKIKQNGFILMETIIAIFMLMMVFVAILSITGKTLLLTKNQNKTITAQYLLQEGIEFIRNNRDSALNTGASWNDFTDETGGGVCSSSSTVGPSFVKSLCQCISATGSKTCSVDPFLNNITECPGNVCPEIAQMSNSTGRSIFCESNNGDCLSFGDARVTDFKRSIKIMPATSLNEVFVDVTVSWKNSGGQSVEKTIKTSLFNW